MVPAFLYGTAWKEERTEALTRLALRAGFRGVDTANQRRHYVEASVGDAVESAVSEGAVARADLFLQTKFTFLAGQDERLPYDPRADVATQVRQSFESSLAHLHTTYLDSYLLHGPTYREGLAAEDWAAWREMERLAGDGKTRLVGVSNVSPGQLSALYAGATVKPAFVQNRCFASTGWDRDVRAFCRDHGIAYQGFSLLTANARVLASAPVARIAAGHRRSPAQIVFRFAQRVGMVPLTGTSSEAHMKEDLATLDFQLSDDEVTVIERAGNA
jgi:diketogulonate reductase-like aldo/keto reductase